MSDLYERLPKYVQIKETIRNEIEDGILKEGEQLPSEASLIDRFGASKMTVIRALQELVQEGYLRRVQGKGTYVTRPIKHHPVIGVLVPRTDKGIFPIMLHSIEEEAHALGYEVFLCSTEEDADKVNTFAERLIARKAAGVLAAPLERVTDPTINERYCRMFKDAGIPLVLLDRGIPELENIPLVQTNNKEAMAKLTQEVLKKGHKRIIIVRCEDIKSTTTDQRIEGFLEAAKNGEADTEIAEVVSISEQKPFNQLVEELESILYEYEPTVIMALNDQIAIQVYSLLKHVNTSLGESVSVTGFDDLPFSQAIGLTTVQQPLSEEGKQAVHMLHKLIRGEPVENIVVESEIVLRSSLRENS